MFKLGVKQDLLCVTIVILQFTMTENVAIFLCPCYYLLTNSVAPAAYQPYNKVVL